MADFDRPNRSLSFDPLFDGTERLRADRVAEGNSRELDDIGIGTAALPCTRISWIVSTGSRFVLDEGPECTGVTASACPERAFDSRESKGIATTLAPGWPDRSS